MGWAITAKIARVAGASALKIKPGQFVLITIKVVVSGRVINHRSPLAVRMPQKCSLAGGLNGACA